MPLVQSQQIAHNKIIELLRGGVTRIKLIGNAGTGKTYLSSEIVKSISKDKTIGNRKNGKIYATAPTNKALAVLIDKMQGLPVEFSTVHSAVKVGRNVDNRTGEESFVKRKYGNKFEDEFKVARLAFIDECSMLERRFVGGYSINPNTLKEDVYTSGWLEDYPFPIIFIGKSLPI